MIEYDSVAGGPSPGTEMFVIYDRTDGHIVSFHGFVGDVTPRSEEERERLALESAPRGCKQENLAALRVPPEFELAPGTLYRVAPQSRRLEVVRVIEEASPRLGSL